MTWHNVEDGAFLEGPRINSHGNPEIWGGFHADSFGGFVGWTRNDAHESFSTAGEAKLWVDRNYRKAFPDAQA